MNSLTNFAMRNITAIVIVMFLLFGGGLFATTKLKAELYPELTLPYLVISTQYAAPPKDILEQITKPLEKSVAGMEGIKKINSNSADNNSSIELILEHGKNTDDAKRDVEALIANVTLPEGAKKPMVLKIGMASIQEYTLALYGKEHTSQEQLDNIYKDVILPKLSTIKGLDHVDSIGNKEAILTIEIDANAINNYALAPAQVAGSIQAAIRTSAVGKVDMSGKNKIVRVKSDLNTIYNLENMKINGARGETILLKDIAKVSIATEAKFFSRLNGQAAIGIVMYKTKEANSMEFAKSVDALIAQWKQEYPDYAFQPVDKNADVVKESVSGMAKEGALGALLASIMILLFLRNVRMTLIVLVSIPLSIVVTLLLMAPLGITLNIMTLGGMAIAVGRVVDDSIVVIENIYSQLIKTQERKESVIKQATAQVSSAITSSTITTVGVFAPIAFVGGQLGDIFRPFAITLTVSLLSSLLVAVTVIPMLAKIMVLQTINLSQPHEEKQGKFLAAYLKTLTWSLNNRKKTLVFAMLAFVAAVGGTAPFLPFEAMPSSTSDKQVFIWVKMPPDTTIEENNQKIAEIESMMRELKNSSGQPAFEYIQSLVGYNGENKEPIPYGSIIKAVAANGSNAMYLAKDMKGKISYLTPKGTVVVSRVMMIGGSGAAGEDFSYVLKGDKLDSLIEGANLVKEKMKEIPEFQEIKDSLSEAKYEVEIAVDQNKARLAGLSSQKIIETAHAWLAEEKLGDLKFDNTILAVRIVIGDRFKDSAAKIGNFTIRNDAGTSFKLNEVATIREIEGPASIPRQMQQQYVKVTAKIDSKDKGGVSAKASKVLKTLSLPDGVHPEVQGVSEDIDREFQNMFVAMGVSVLIVYLVMVLAFGNGGAPFVILFSLPLGIIGGLLGLFVTGESVNLTSLIGFLMLIGVVVTNAIVLVDRVMQLQEDGYTTREALLEAGRTRLRPIIMTAGATVIALLPLALGLSQGTIISKGLAVVVIGGLTTSTVLTLLIVPVVYEVVENIKRRFGLLIQRNKIQNDIQMEK